MENKFYLQIDNTFMCWLIWGPWLSFLQGFMQPHLLGNEFTHLEFPRRVQRKEVGKRMLYRDFTMSGWWVAPWLLCFLHWALFSLCWQNPSWLLHLWNARLTMITSKLITLNLCIHLKCNSNLKKGLLVYLAFFLLYYSTLLHNEGWGDQPRANEGAAWADAM